MNGRIIKAYVEMKQSQTQNTPLIKNKNQKTSSLKAKHCLGKTNSNKVSENSLTK